MVSRRAIGRRWWWKTICLVAAIDTRYSVAFGSGFYRLVRKFFTACVSYTLRYFSVPTCFSHAYMYSSFVIRLIIYCSFFLFIARSLYRIHQTRKSVWIVKIDCRKNPREKSDYVFLFSVKLCAIKILFRWLAKEKRGKR